MEFPRDMVSEPLNGEVKRFVTLYQEYIRATLFRDDFKANRLKSSSLWVILNLFSFLMLLLFSTIICMPVPYLHGGRSLIAIIRMTTFFIREVQFS